MRVILFTIICAFSHLISQAQTGQLSGTVSDKDAHTPVVNAVISLFSPVDSTLLYFGRTDMQGKYIVKNIQPGDYLVMASHPAFADIYYDVVINGNTGMPEIGLSSKAKLLEEVIVKGGSAIRIKGDTTIFNADSFAVGPNANVEELLKKLPGMQVDKDGNITAMGESVKKVLVDGEEFFGDDPGMAVKNLRADAVKEVQVFDKKSENAEFTGIDDGQTQKTINLKLKEDKKTGYFGKIDAAGGPAMTDQDARYNTNLLYSNFKGKRRLSAFLLNGNTGQDGLNWDDKMQLGAMDNMEVSDDGSSIFFTSGGSSDGEPYVDTDNGFITNVNGGLQYNNKWGDRYKLNLSPRYNQQNYRNLVESLVQTRVGDSILNQNTESYSHVNRKNLKLQGVLEIQIDSSNSLKISAGATFYNTNSDQQSNLVTTGDAGTLKNTSSRNLITDYEKTATAGNILYRHKFKKDRRTITFTGDWYSLNNDGNSLLKSNNTAYFGGDPSGIQDINQKKNSSQETRNISAKILYTEPLTKELALQVGYRLSNSQGTNNQVTYDFSGVTGHYDLIVDSLSNDFRQNITENVPSATLNFAKKKLQMNVGSGIGFTHFDLEDITFSKTYIRNYSNFYPSANITYTYKPNRTIRFSYSGATRQPTINQLQPLRNNNDYFNQQIGNPDLQPSFTNNFNLSTSTYNFIKDWWFYANASLRTTHNAITNSSVIDLDSGKTVSQSVNVNGNYSFNFYGGMAFKVKKINLQIQISPQLSLSRYPSIINHVISFSNTTSPGAWLYLSKSKEKKYDFSVINNFSYNINNATQTSDKIKYYTNTLEFSGTVYYKKVWSLNSSYNYLFNQKAAGIGSDIKINLWNARFQRTFHNDEFTVYFTIRDILNQNKGVQQYFSGYTYSQTINERLKRYFMLGFAWNFKNK